MVKHLQTHTAHGILEPGTREAVWRVSLVNRRWLNVAAAVALILMLAAFKAEACECETPPPTSFLQTARSAGLVLHIRVRDHIAGGVYDKRVRFEVLSALKGAFAAKTLVIEGSDATECSYPARHYRRGTAYLVALPKDTQSGEVLPSLGPCDGTIVVLKNDTISLPLSILKGGTIPLPLSAFKGFLAWPSSP